MNMEHFIAEIFDKIASVVLVAHDDECVHAVHMLFDELFDLLKATAAMVVVGPEHVVESYRAVQYFD